MKTSLFETVVTSCYLVAAESIDDSSGSQSMFIVEYSNLYRNSTAVLSRDCAVLSYTKRNDELNI